MCASVVQNDVRYQATIGGVPVDAYHYNAFKLDSQGPLFIVMSCTLNLFVLAGAVQWVVPLPVANEQFNNYWSAYSGLIYNQVAACTLYINGLCCSRELVACSWTIRWLLRGLALAKT